MFFILFGMVVVASLSKSGRAVFVFPGDGSVWMVPAYLLRMLVDGRANGGKVVFKQLSGASVSSVDRLTGIVPDSSKRLSVVSGLEDF